MVPPLCLITDAAGWDLSLAACDGRVELVAVTIFPVEAENIYSLTLYSKNSDFPLSLTLLISKES